jgi:hypothetical protein
LSAHWARPSPLQAKPDPPIISWRLWIQMKKALWILICLIEGCILNTGAVPWTCYWWQLCNRILILCHTDRESLTLCQCLLQCRIEFQGPITLCGMGSKHHRSVVLCYKWAQAGWNWVAVCFPSFSNYLATYFFLSDWKSIRIFQNSWGLECFRLLYSFEPKIHLS